MPLLNCFHLLCEKGYRTFSLADNLVECFTVQDRIPGHLRTQLAVIEWKSFLPTIQCFGSIFIESDPTKHLNPDPEDS